MSLLGRDPGDFHELVTFEGVTSTDDDEGGTSEAVAEIASVPDVWARVRPLSAMERIRAEQTEGVITHEVEVRYRDDIGAQKQILWGARRLQIIGPGINPDMRSQFLLFRCRELAGA